MILSHEHEFIFIKTKKTAGTSVELALSQICGPDDIITPVSEEDEELRSSIGARGPQYYERSIRDFRLRDVAVAILKAKHPKRFFNHISARQVRDEVGMSTWEAYFTFCFERNPWDKAVSLYHWETRDSETVEFGEYLESGRLQVLRETGGWHCYTDQGEIIVDRVFRYEDLSESLESIRDVLGCEESVVLPHAKSGTRPAKQDYRSYYTPALVTLVREIFREEIETFGYTFN